MPEQRVTVTFAIEAESHALAVAAFARWMSTGMVERFARHDGIEAAVVELLPQEIPESPAQHIDLRAERPVE